MLKIKFCLVAILSFIFCYCQAWAFNSAYTGADVEATVGAYVNRVTTVGDPGSDASFTTEQAQREALNAKQGTLTNEAGLYSALSDVTDFVQPGENVTVLDGTAWRVFYTDTSGNITELALGADGTYLKSNGAAAAPTFATPAGGGDLLADGTVPLTANWDVGAFTVTGTQFIFDIAIGTAPFEVTSTTVVTNLNTDTLDGEEATAFEDADAAIVKSDEAETITANWDFTANPMADNEVANDISLDLLKLSALTSAPGSPVAGRIYYADNDTWDPCNEAGTNNYYCIYDGADYKGIVDEDGNYLVSSICVPTYEEDELNDDTGDRLLTLAEIRGPFISNKGVGAAFHLDFPAHSSDDTWNVCLVKEEDQDFTVDPNSTEQWWFRNDNSAFSQLAAGENIVNTTNGRSTLCIKSTEDGVYATGDANWAEETP